MGCATDNTQSYCITKQGGTFAQGKSRTFQSVANAGAAGAETSENVTIPSPSNWGQDNLGLGSDRAVQGFPLGLLDPNINTHSLVIGLGRAALGLGKNSTVLSKLKSAGFIGSRTFGLWWGLAGATPAAQVEGSLVFGGYDAAKIKSGGKNHTGSITEATLCPSGMTIMIASMVLNFPNGTNPSLLDLSLGGALLQACICLQCSLVLMMPLDPYYQRFETLTNTHYIDRSMGINFFNMLYLSSDVYQGDLTITLDSSFSVRIPNSQLVQPDQKISDTGDVVSNTSVSNVNLYSLQDVMKNDFPLLGFWFFTAAYLMVNHDAGTFTMWEANPTTDTKLVAIPADDTTSACTATTT